jgi:hypothetical protein
MSAAEEAVYLRAPRIDELEYDRNDLRRWLLDLPQNEPFCLNDCCPLTTYWLQTGASIPAGTLRNRALKADFDLVAAIDGHKASWSDLTPRRVLKLIDRLERKALKDCRRALSMTG